MQLLAQEEYGLRCLLQVARREGTKPLTIPEIARAEGLSVEYTGKLMRALRQGGMVVSTRGAGGGYCLSRGATEITPWDVIRALGGSFFEDGFCETHPGRLQDCIHRTDCSIRSLWQRVEHAVRDVLDSMTLADLARDERSMAIWLDSPPDRRSSTSHPEETA